MAEMVPPDDGGLDTLSALQSLLLSTPDVEGFLAEVTRLAADAVDAPTSCGVTTASERGPRTVATSDERAALVDEEQYTEGEGPCLEALRVGKFIEVEDQAIDDRWPAYRDHAVRLGVRCSISYPLIVQTRSSEPSTSTASSSPTHSPNRTGSGPPPSRPRPPRRWRSRCGSPSRPR
jgi:hypothetical protein